LSAIETGIEPLTSAAIICFESTVVRYFFCRWFLRLSFVGLVVVYPLSVQSSMSSVVDVSSVASSLEQYRLRTQRKNRIARKEKAKYVRPSRAEASLAAVNAARLAER
jgi:hypothetical protein